ncbi:MAG TPA: hypothetical protein VHS07_01980, partial [Candidatus Binataceae bacterium]|nr:hypothetical protein [Candidatus Binataceae bacterium]
MDAELKGVTGDLFGSPITPARGALKKAPPAEPGKSRETVSAEPRSPIIPLPPRSAVEKPATPAATKAAPARASRSAVTARKLPAYFYRLPLRAQRCYLASDAIDRLPLTPSPAAFALVAALMSALEGGAPSSVQRASQALLGEVCRLFRVPPVRMEVRSVRPRNSRGELHGLFYPQAPVRSAAPSGRLHGGVAGNPLIVLWMRTAQRHDVVKPRTYLRTLLHELGHYLDYALLKLEDSYHSVGFYQRESFLLRTLCPKDSPPRA